jgi:hypothetical protein
VEIKDKDAQKEPPKKRLKRLTTENGDFWDDEGDFLNILGDCAPGWTVSVKRLTPKWCAGHLDTMDVTPESPMSVELLKELFGGRKLVITIRDENGIFRGQRRVEFPDPPRNGEGQIEIDPEEKKAAAAAAATATAGNASQFSAISEMFKTVLESQNKQSAQMIQMLNARLESVERKAEAAAKDAQNVEYEEPPPEPSTLERIRELAETMESIDALKSKIAPTAQPGAEGAGEAGLLDGLVKEFFTMQLEKEKAKIQNSTGSGKTSRAPGPAPDLPQRNAPPAQAAPPPVNGQSIHDLSDEDLAIIVHQRLKNMDPEKLSRVMSIFSGEYDLIDPDTGEIEDGNAEPAELDEERKTRVRSENRGKRAAKTGADVKPIQ